VPANARWLLVACVSVGCADAEPLGGHLGTTTIADDDGSANGESPGDTLADTGVMQPDAGVAELPTCADMPASALDLVGYAEGVHVGDVPALGLEHFTLAAWIRWDGWGTRTDSGVGGIVAEPIVAKGRGESDGSTVDCNYFVGIDADGRLVADFEDMATGANHPIASVAAIEIGRWTHVAASYDGAMWQLWIDGELDTALATGATPRFDSIQHFGIGTTYDSQGVPEGAFDGRIDEVRVWDRALAELELQSSMFAAPVADGLIGDWPLDDTPGMTAPEMVAGFDGTRMGTSWIAEGRPVGASTPPPEPVPVGPAETVAAGDVMLALDVADIDDDELVVEFFGRELVDPEPFTIVVVPDTQFYTDETNGGLGQMFYDLTQWTADNAEALDVRAVLHVGDLVDDYHNSVDEWLLAQEAMETLEQTMPGYPDGLPYGIAIGNHDQATDSATGQTQFYNMYFGVDRFEGRTYYGGHHGDRNDSSFITFTAGAVDFLAVFVQFDEPGTPEGNTGPDPESLAWARRVIAEHPDHRAIVVAHSCLVWTGCPIGQPDCPGGGDGPKIGTELSEEGRIRWEALKGEKNLSLVLCGHRSDEGRRTDAGASMVHTLMSDYQFDGNGGSGKLRLMTFDPAAGEVEVETYSPYFDESYESADSHFVLPFDLDGGAGAFESLGRVEHVASGATVELAWPELASGRSFEWYATVSDCTHTAASARVVFTTE
jgi:hypothetical protein